MKRFDKDQILFELEEILCDLYDRYIDRELDRVDIIEKFIFTAGMLEPDLEVNHKWARKKSS